MPKPAEWQIQNAVRIWLDGVPDKDIRGHALPGVEWWHTPNEGKGRTAWQGKQLKDAGVKRGVHDVMVFHQRQLYCLELKDENGTYEPDQISWGERMAAQGAKVACVYSFAEAKAQLIAWGLALE